MVQSEIEFFRGTLEKSYMGLRKKFCDHLRDGDHPRDGDGPRNTDRPLDGKHPRGGHWSLF